MEQWPASAHLLPGHAADPAPPALPELPIAAGIDVRYVLPLRVMLTSLRDRLRGMSPVLYLLHRGLPDEALAAIGEEIDTRPIDCSAASLPESARGSFPLEAAAPLLLAELLPRDLSRVLFLDADLLVLDDVAKLWREDLSGRVLAACRDGAIATCGSSRGVHQPRSEGIPADAEYFNAGVLSIDLDAWREREVTARAYDYLERTGAHASFFHQEAMNAVLWDDWRPLARRWNLLGGVAGRSFERPRSDAWRDPGIVHFAGRVKPWHARVGGRFGAAYRAVLERVATPGSGADPRWCDGVAAWYDRGARELLYPLERMLWKARLI